MLNSALGSMTSLMSPLVTLAAHWFMGVASDTDAAFACQGDSKCSTPMLCFREQEIEFWAAHWLMSRAAHWLMSMS
jgi:hypothetical protein